MFQRLQGRGPDYAPCRYGKSKILFRGPKQATTGRYCAIAGGAEVFGEYVDQPFAAQIGVALDVPVLNLGCVGAGVGTFAGDLAIRRLCSGADLTVVQVLGAQNLSNRFYKVHPRRNARFVRATPALAELYPTLSTDDISTTAQLVSRLRDISDDRFDLVRAELCQVWLTLYRRLARRLSCPTVLLTLLRGEELIGDRAPWVTEEMVQTIEAEFSASLTLRVPQTMFKAGTKGMVFDPVDRSAARAAFTPDAHNWVAGTLAPVLRHRLNRA